MKLKKNSGKYPEWVMAVKKAHTYFKMKTTCADILEEYVTFENVPLEIRKVAELIFM